MMARSNQPAGTMERPGRFAGARARRALIGALPFVALGCNGADARRERHRADAVADTVSVAHGDSLARARQDSLNRAQPGYIVDSILPIEEELRRFRHGMTPTAALAGGAPSREALVAGFVQALETNDTTTLRRLALTPEEYAYLVYPSSPYTTPPYRQAAGLRWMLIQRESAAGLARLLQRLGGRALGFTRYSCDDSPEREGANRLWKGCTLRLSTAISPTPLRAFGTLIERDGRWKFVSYANDY